MNTTEQAEFLSSIMEELENDPEYQEEDKQLIKAGYDYIKPLLGPQKLYAGYQHGYYYVRINGSATLGTIRELTAEGYNLLFLEPPFGKPVMLKKRDD